MSKTYDFLIVGAGLFGAVCARELTDAGYSCLVIDKRSHIAGNIYTKEENGINVHEYGAHIFHTSDKKIWEYVNRFAEFNNYINSPVARYKDELYNLPFNMNTFSKMWGIKTPDEARKIIDDQIKELGITEPANLEEQALSMVGRDVYEKLVKGYTEKQWGRDCRDLPSFIIKRLPLRFTFNNNYFSDRFQGIPMGGYTALVEKLLEGSDVRLGTDYFKLREDYISDHTGTEFCDTISGPESPSEKTDDLQKSRCGTGSDPCCGLARHLIYTGQIDSYFDYKLGILQYRTLRFEKEWLDTDNFQGCAVVNYTEREIPYTRIIEHKHFEFGQQKGTVITREYPAEWKQGDEPYYPVNDARNTELYKKYAELAAKERNVTFGGRLGQYKYYDMDKVIAAALDTVEALKNTENA
ncbi:MAG: NAD(P)-binding protein [Lachnospiraceae bacterium]|nr:NAD(P)-binding protein [Lachnospiraceae bacterium]